MQSSLAWKQIGDDSLSTGHKTKPIKVLLHSSPGYTSQDFIGSLAKARDKI